MKFFYPILISLVSVLQGCDDRVDMSGTWQGSLCIETPCAIQPQLNIGQYGNALAGLMTWHKTQPGIDTFNSPSFQCDCNYIEAGTVDGDSLRIVSRQTEQSCNSDIRCGPCHCGRYRIQLNFKEDEALEGQLTCDSGEQYELRLTKTLTPASKSCLDSRSP